MEIRYNVTGVKRKELVKVIADATGARAEYKFMPTCNYEIDYFTVTKDGILWSTMNTGQMRVKEAAISTSTPPRLRRVTDRFQCSTL